MAHDGILLRLLAAMTLAGLAGLWLHHELTVVSFGSPWLVAVGALAAATAGLFAPTPIGTVLVVVGGVAVTLGALALPFLALFTALSDGRELTWTDFLLWASLAAFTLLAGALYLETGRRG